MFGTKVNAATCLLCQCARLEVVISKANTQHNVSVDILLQEYKATIKIEHPSGSNLAFQMSMICDAALSTLDNSCMCHACDYLHSAHNDVTDFFEQC